MNTTVFLICLARQLVFYQCASRRDPSTAVSHCWDHNYRSNLKRGIPSTVLLAAWHADDFPALQKMKITHVNMLSRFSKVDLFTSQYSGHTAERK